MLERRRRGLERRIGLGKRRRVLERRRRGLDEESVREEEC